jgi:hypothetical protein
MGVSKNAEEVQEAPFQKRFVPLVSNPAAPVQRKVTLGEEVRKITIGGQEHTVKGQVWGLEMGVPEALSKEERPIFLQWSGDAVDRIFPTVAALQASIQTVLLRETWERVPGDGVYELVARATDL